jgi:hypothetical protein
LVSQHHPINNALAFIALFALLLFNPARLLLIDQPLSDNSWTFIKFAKKEFGKDVPIQQCCVHFTGALQNPDFSNLFQTFLSSNLRF